MDIKAISVLLERFGSTTSYNIYLDIYETDIHGQTNETTPIATIIKLAEDINNLEWYNFVLDEPITTSSEYISVILRQDHIDDENFIVWSHSNINTSNLNSYGYAIDNLQSITSDEYYDNFYFYGYGYGYDKLSGQSYFDLLNIYGITDGYNLDDTDDSIPSYGYGYELSPISIFNDFIRCIKIYSDFNNIVQNSSGATISIPEKETQSITLNSRQDFVNGYKNNVIILDNHITLNGLGNRLVYVDRRDSEKSIISSNIGLPPIVTCYDITTGTDEYNCLGLCGSELDGLYQSTNSGASWTKITTFISNDITCVKISPDTNLFAVAAELISSNLYISQDQGDTWTTVSITGSVTDIQWYNNDILYFSTESNGVWQYTVSTNTLTESNTGLSAIPTGRKLYIDLTGTTDKIYWTTSVGLYMTTTIINWTQLGSSSSISSCYSVLAMDDIIYVGLETGIAISTDSGSTFYGHLSTDEVRFKGLLLEPVISINYDITNNIIYTGQSGQISYSYGNIFKQLVDDFSYDNDILNVIVNPYNSDIIHILTRNNVGNTIYFTYLIDNSDSLSYNDTNNKRKEIVDDINDALTASDRDYIAQIIQFSGIQNPTNSTNGLELYEIANNTLYAQKQIQDITGGFLRPINDGDLDGYINLIGAENITETTYTTPLIDALYTSLKSIITGGFEWTNDDDTGNYRYDIIKNYETEIYDAQNVIIIATDCHDNDSLRQISGLINDTNLKNKIKFKVYLIVIGSDFDKNFINILDNYFNKFETFICYSDSDIDNAISYISSIESNNTIEGCFRKQILLSETFSEVTSTVIEVNLPTSSYAKFRFRASSNNDDLLNESFSDYYDLTNGTNTITLGNIICKYFEIEVYLKKQILNAFPSLNSITINYNECSTSKIVFNKTDYSTDKIGQILLTRDLFLDDYYISSSGYCYGYGYDYQDKTYGYGMTDIPFLDDYWYFSESNSWNANTSETIKKERISYTKRRVKEPTTTDDYYIYELKNGPWSKDRDCIVYKNNIEESSKNFSADPNTGIIRSHQQLNKTDVITVTISPASKRRYFTDIYNSLNSKNLILTNTSIEYLPETTNKTYKSPLPSFTSQSVYDYALFTDSTLIYPQNNRTITAYYIPSKTIIENKQSTPSIKTGEYIYFTLGEKFIYLDSDLEDTEYYDLLPHQNSWIFGKLNDIDSNQLKLTTTNNVSSFLMQQTEDNDYQFAVFTTHGSQVDATETLSLTIGSTEKATNGFNFYINQNIETKHIECDSGGDEGGLSTYVWMGFGRTTENIEGELEYSNYPLKTVSTDSNLGLRIINDVTPDNREVKITIQIIDKNGNLYTGYTSDLYISTYGYISLYYSSYPFQDISNSTDVIESQLIKSIKVEASNLGQISYTFSVPDGVTIISATIQAIPSATAYGPPIIYHRNLSIPEKLYFGDLNVRSAVSTGRQSPDFIYEYARDIAKLDFCSIADNLKQITVKTNKDRFIQIERKANKYNVSNQFVTFSGFRIIPYDYNNSNQYYGIRTIISQDLTSHGLSTKPLTEESIDAFFSRMSSESIICMLQTTCYKRDMDNSIGLKYNHNTYRNYDVVNENMINNDNAFEVYSEQGQTYYYDTSNLLGLYSYEKSNGYYFMGSISSKKTMAALSNSNSDISRPGLYHGELKKQSSFPDYNNRGITGVWSSELTRSSIFDSIRNSRRTFASTGTRGFLDFKVKIKSTNKTLVMGNNDSVNREHISDGINILVNCIQNTNATLFVYRVDVEDPIELKEPMAIGSSTIQYKNPIFTTTISDTSVISIDEKITRVCYFIKVIFESGSINDKHVFWSTPIYIDII